MGELINKQIRGSNTYFFEVLYNGSFQTPLPYPGPIIPQPARIDLSNIINDTQSATDRPVLYNISLSDYVIEHEEGWDQNERELLVLSSNEITQGKTRFMTLLGSDSGIGLFGSNNIVLQFLPSIASIKFGFIDVLNARDNNVYDPNTAITFTNGLISQTFSSQQIKYALFRFQITCNYL